MADQHFELDPARAGRVADDLTAMRRRGLEELDTPTGGERPEDYPEVEALAVAYCRAAGVPVYGRAAAIRALLHAAIPAYAHWGNADESEELDLLFFGSPERVAELAPETRPTTTSKSAGIVQRRPQGRREAARRLRGLDDKRYTEHQRQVFLGFAPFLVGFVAETVRNAETPPAAHTTAGATATASAATGRWAALLTTLLAAGLVATALVLAVLPGNGRLSAGPSATNGGTPTTITGYAKCAPDASKPVVGVWIVAGNGGSGWADWHALPGQANVAWFSRTLPNGGSYVVHVGCGGTPAHWEQALTSTTEVLGSGYTFTCYDVPPGGDPTQARCQPAAK